MNKLIKITKTNQNDLLSLKKKLINLLHEYFNLRVQSKLGKLKQLHLLKQYRHDIAFLKSCLSQRKNFDKK